MVRRLDGSVQLGLIATPGCGVMYRVTAVNNREFSGYTDVCIPPEMIRFNLNSGILH
jgi:hypothetical protein